MDRADRAKIDINFEKCNNKTDDCATPEEFIRYFQETGPAMFLASNERYIDYKNYTEPL